MSDLLGEQKRYYAERAPEYDDWWFRRGRYGLEPEALARWQQDIAEVETALDVFAPRGCVLELAAGTGIWTRKLVRLADRVVAVDANAETLALNTFDAELVQADVFDWRPEEPVDVVFFSFWLSHVPPARFDPFWAMVRAALRPGGRAFFIDSLPEPTSTAKDHGPIDESGVSRRKLNDGREFNIVKVFYQPSVLERRLAELGWSGWVRSTNKFFLYGLMTARK